MSKGFTSEWLDQLLAKRARPMAGNAAHSAPDPKPEHDGGHESVATGQGEARDARSRQVSIVSRRCRLLDPGANLWGGTKHLEDALRYAGILFDDSEKFIEIKVSQEKVRTKKEEETVVTIARSMDTNTPTRESDQAALERVLALAKSGMEPERYQSFERDVNHLCNHISIRSYPQNEQGTR